MAKLSVGMIKGLLMAVIILVILFTVLNDTANDVGEAAGNLSQEANSTGSCVTDSGGCRASQAYPLISFFQKKGVLLLAFIAGIIIVLVVAFLSISKGK